jgi:uncharacterized protein YjgD (DUF1641 family)
MKVTRAEFQEKSVYIENAYKDVMENLQTAMAKYNKFTTTGELEALNGITAMLDEAVLAISDLAMAVNSELPDVSALPAEVVEEATSESEVPF